ncbi:Hsp70 family protein [Actinoalloteichus sp. GBA129-24]|uniref:Hsp70 family protein n=1 Tax=Actinoalloteichus sp. GBA129-24 TaxID=1612551 RepID=UPI0009507B85|nr:Hsp70 family protein [Actinoalloteichus sp. GBA129-24]APU21891.1 Hsp70 protein [Actinoalloteichus sp. GBA129-24]
MRELAVDFGTSNTVAALRIDGGPARLLLFDGWPVLPSAVLSGRDGTLVVGREALRGARLDPARFEPHPKERIDEGEVLLGDAVVPVVSLIASVLRRVAAEAARVDRVVLTHPADWHATRRGVLLAAAREAGWLGDVRVVAEPVAAAGLAPDVAPGQAIAVFDMGGGTTDVAVLRRGATGWEVLAEAGLPDLGGRDLDQLLLEHLGVAHLVRLGDVASRRRARAVAEDVQAGREALSQYPQTDIPLPPPLPDAHLTRDELEGILASALDRAVGLLADTVLATPVVAVHLVGGATRMPLVARLIGRRLGLVPTIVDSPETAVVLGALAPTAAPTPPASAPASSAQSPVPRQTAPLRLPQPGGTPSTPQTSVAVRRWSMPVIVGLAVLVLAAVGLVMAAALRWTSSGTPLGDATPSIDSSAGPDRDTNTGSNAGADTEQARDTETDGVDSAAFGADDQLLAFAGPSAVDCVNAMGTHSQGDMYEARNHVRCRFEHEGIVYFANYLSSDDAETCLLLNQAFTDTPESDWRSDQPWAGGGFSGRSHDVTTIAGNTVLWYADTNSLCGFFGPATDYNPVMPDVRAAWEAVVRLRD